MSGQFNDNMWEQDGSDWNNQNPHQGAQQQYQFYGNNDMVLNADQLSFQQSSFESPAEFTQSSKMSFFYDQPQHYEQPNMEMLHPTGYDIENEPPLLEELEIYPDLIYKKIKSVLDPFCMNPPVGDHDLGGPLIFCLLFGITTFCSAGRINFSYVYGIGVSSCIFMYFLLMLMSQQEKPSLVAVASIMGYGLIPVVALSTLGVFLRLTNPFGIGLAILAILWSALAASKEFTSILSIEVGFVDPMVDGQLQLGAVAKLHQLGSIEEVVEAMGPVLVGPKVLQGRLLQCKEQLGKSSC